MNYSKVMGEGGTALTGQTSQIPLGNGALKLAAGSINIPSPRPPDIGGNAGIAQYFLERKHTLFCGSLKVNTRSGVKRNQVDLSPYAANQLHHLMRLLLAIVDPVEQHVFKRQPLTISHGKFAGCGEQLLQVPFFVDGHDAGAGSIIRSV